MARKSNERMKAIKRRPAAWHTVGTPSKTRMNIFCLEQGDARHIATMIAGSSSKIDAFLHDVEIMRLAPEFIRLLDETNELLRRLDHIFDPETKALRRRVELVLSLVDNGLGAEG